MTVRARCECCECHTRAIGEEPCDLCGWPEAGYTLDEARANVESFGIVLRPSDRRFAVRRHPILGARGEYAIDRVALRERAYAELRMFGRGRADRIELSERLESLLICILSADRLYRM